MVMLEVEIVVMRWCCDGESEDGGVGERKRKGGVEDGGFVVVGGDVVKDGEVVVRIVTRMIAGDISRVEGASLEFEVVASLGEDGVEVVWWKDLWVLVILEKVKEMVEFW